MRRMSAAAVLVGAVLLAPQPASAASKEQQLLLAELRIMQQNQQQLAQSLLALAESLKTVTGRLDERATTSRKALADQRLLIEGMTDTVRTLREKSDDTNVRLSSITQELESIRQTISALPMPGRRPRRSGADRRLPRPRRLRRRRLRRPRSAAQRLAAAHLRQRFLRLHGRPVGSGDRGLPHLPEIFRATSERAVNIGNALYSAGKFKEAVTEYQRVISDYPDDSVAAAYKLGLTYNQLKQPDLAGRPSRR